MLALPAAGCAGVRVPEPVRRPLGLASITVARELAADYAGTLARVKALGYTHWSFALGPLSPRQAPPPDAVDVARMARVAGLAIGVARLGQAHSPGAQMALAARIGATIVAQSASPVFFTGPRPGATTRKAFEAWLPQLAELSQAARGEGLRLVYHNHHWDHVALEGMTPLEIIADRFAPGEVDFEIDLAWAKLGGADPLALVRALGPRVLSLHYKDVDPARGPDLHAQLAAPGEGTMNYAQLVKELDRASPAIGYVEVDMPADGLMAAATGASTIMQARKQI